MSGDTAVAIAGVITLAFGGAGAHVGFALIRNLHDLNDRLLKNYVDRPGGWRRSDHHDPSPGTEGVGFSFEYVPQTSGCPFQALTFCARRIGVHLSRARARVVVCHAPAPRLCSRACWVEGGSRRPRPG